MNTSSQAVAPSPRRRRAPHPKLRAAPTFVVGAPFSGATILAWALAQHPDVQPVIGSKPAGDFAAAMRLVESDLVPLTSPSRLTPLFVPAGRRPHTLVVNGPELAARVAPARLLFPGAKVIHVHRAAEDVIPLIVGAARREGSPLTDAEAEGFWRRVAGDCVEAEEAVGCEGSLRLDHADLVSQPESALLRALELLGLDWTPECLWPLRLLVTDPSAARPAAPPPAPTPRPVAPTGVDDTFARHLRQLTEAVTPRGATILVASRGDERLLRFRGRTGLHFPQLEDGTWAGFYPADSAAAISHLRELTVNGASHVLFPHTALWWLDHYPELRGELETAGRLLACDVEVGVVWELPGAQHLALPATLASPHRMPREPDNSAAFEIENRREPPRRQTSLGGSLWAVTTFYNPAGYHTKKANYDRFRAGLAASDVPLLTVELAFGADPFQLSQTDADMLVQLRGGDVLWQKERLVNIGVGHLPPECDRVAWIDADVLFTRADWAEETKRLLRDYAVVQPFSHCVRLPRDVDSCEPAALPFGSGEAQLFYGIAWGLRAKGLASLDNYQRHGHTGFAWAARRTLLESHGLYDANLLGNGDTDIAHAMFGSLEYWALGKLGPRARAHLFRWAEPFAGAVGGSVAHVGGLVTHLWHGYASDRQYDRRLEVLREFDPDLHLERGGRDGLLSLTDTAPAELRAWTQEYFSARREDG
jgi:hypothetical protein